MSFHETIFHYYYNGENNRSHNEQELEEKGYSKACFIGQTYVYANRDMIIRNGGLKNIKRGMINVFGEEELKYFHPSCIKCQDFFCFEVPSLYKSENEDCRLKKDMDKEKMLDNLFSR